jgi:hypothetical protein
VVLVLEAGNPASMNLDQIPIEITYFRYTGYGFIRMLKREAEVFLLAVKFTASNQGMEIPAVPQEQEK